MMVDRRSDRFCLARSHSCSMRSSVSCEFAHTLCPLTIASRLMECEKLFGYDQGVLGAVLGLPSFRKQFDNPSANLEGIIAAIYDTGCLVGAIVAFLTADRFGRRGSILRGCWVMVVGTLLQTSATGSVLLIIGRIVTGIGNGINTVNVPIWQAESFKSHNRGARRPSIFFSKAS